MKSLNPLQSIKADKESWASGAEVPDIVDLEGHIASLKEIRDAFVEAGLNSDIYNPVNNRLEEDNNPETRGDKDDLV